MKKVIYDQDGFGERDHNLYGLLVLLQAPGVELVGITTVSGREWSPRQTPRALEVLKLLGRPEIPVAPGAVFPLINTATRTARWEHVHGRLFDAMCLDQDPDNLPSDLDPFWLPPPADSGLPVPPSPSRVPSVERRSSGARRRANFEGGTPTNPQRGFGAGDALRKAPPDRLDTTRATEGARLEEPAASFMVRMARQYPGEISLVATGPLTNLALAIRLDPGFPRLLKEVIFVGGRFMPYSRTGQFSRAPGRREANLRHDPEAAHIVLNTAWGRGAAGPGSGHWAAEQRGEMASRFRCGPSEGIPGGYFESRAPSKGAARSPRCDPPSVLSSAITCLPRDLTDPIRITRPMHEALARLPTPLGRFINTLPYDLYAKGDALAAALCADPGLIKTTDTVCLDVDLSPGANYGCLLNWRGEDFAPKPTSPPVRVVTAIHETAFTQAFLRWCGADFRHRGHRAPTQSSRRVRKGKEKTGQELPRAA